MGGARKARSSGDVISIDAFRKRPALNEGHLAKQLSDLRLMLLRGEKENLILLLRRSPACMEAIAKLVRDEYVGVSPAAADILREACLEGMDITYAVPSLVNALDDPYTKRCASAALAAYYERGGDKERLHELRNHEDPIVRDAAC